MNIRIAWVAAAALLLVTAAWWLLSDFSSTPENSGAPQPSDSAAASALRSAGPPTQPDEGDYPTDYVDDFPLDDAPPLPSSVANDYAPTFEMPDLIGDGMRVPVEIDIGDPGPIYTDPSDLSE